MEQTFTIQGRFCSLNEFYRLHHYAQGKTKAEHEQRVIEAAKSAGIKPVARCTYSVLWIEQNHRRDLDNVAYGKKFIQDGLVKAGIIPNDTADYIAGFSDSFAYDAKDPRIIVTIHEIE